MTGVKTILGYAPILARPPPRSRATCRKHDSRSGQERPLLVEAVGNAPGAELSRKRSPMSNSTSPSQPEPQREPQPHPVLRPLPTEAARKAAELSPQQIRDAIEKGRADLEDAETFARDSMVGISSDLRFS
jgi:hypothetical protein